MELAIAVAAKPRTHGVGMNVSVSVRVVGAEERHSCDEAAMAKSIAMAIKP